MKLSNKAIHDLRCVLGVKYGVDFVNLMSDEQINNIGLIVLTAVVEKIKLK